MAVDTDHVGAGVTRSSKKESTRSLSQRFLRAIASAFQGLFSRYLFSSIIKRILILNLVALVLFMGGISYLNQFRDGLVEARVESLLTQGDIIAGAIAASASVETDTIVIDPETILELQAGETAIPSVDPFDNLAFPIDPERVAPVLRRLISPTRTRARIYDQDADLLLDSRHLYSSGQILRYGLSNQSVSGVRSIMQQVGEAIRQFLTRSDLPTYREVPGGSGAEYPEVIKALSGSKQHTERLSEDGELIIFVAVPIQRFRAVLGVLHLSTQGADIDEIVQAERLAMLRVFAVALLVNILLSTLLARTIATPLRRLSEAAVRVRQSIKMREEIPDLSFRQDEIGNLSSALRSMTSSLYARIDAIESFAADVSHELKNPLTSLRSAVETLPLIKNEDQRNKLLMVIQHDIGRLDRLITDISDASRLDAELVREDAEPVDLEKLLRDLVTVFIESRMGEFKLKMRVDRRTANEKFVVQGHELRIGQVVTNLIENARTFIPKENGRVDVVLQGIGNWREIIVEDNGPGIGAENVEKIFQRFYTDRPGVESFGKNSGLGLSISRQIIEAHDGTLHAENILDLHDSTKILGARFTIRLPVHA
ncbi:MAG: sensor histidine kinase [Pseudomonadota bacterium]